MDLINNDTNETNPYLVIVSRKARNLRKKLDKIKTYEAKPTSSLNDEQIALIALKGSVEKSLADIESVRLQIQEIANELSLTNPKPILVECGNNTNAIPEAVAATTQVESLESTETGTQCENATQNDLEPSSSETTASTSSCSELKEDIVKDALQKIFSALHVCTLYKEKTGKELPENVDFFGKSLLGLTSILRFRETMEKSVQAASLYLDDTVGKEHEVIRGVSYYAMSVIIEELALQMDGVPLSDETESRKESSDGDGKAIEDFPPEIDFYYNTTPDEPSCDIVSSLADVETKAESINACVDGARSRRSRDNKTRNRPQSTNREVKYDVTGDTNITGDSAATIPSDESSNNKEQRRSRPRGQTKAPKSVSIASTDRDAPGQNIESGAVVEKTRHRYSRRQKNANFLGQNNSENDVKNDQSDLQVTSVLKKAPNDLFSNSSQMHEAQSLADSVITKDPVPFGVPRSRASYRPNLQNRRPYPQSNDQHSHSPTEKSPNDHQKPQRHRPPQNYHENRKPNTAQPEASTSSTSSAQVPNSTHSSSHGPLTDPRKSARFQHAPRPHIPKSSTLPQDSPSNQPGANQQLQNPHPQDRRIL